MIYIIRISFIVKWKIKYKKIQTENVEETEQSHQFINKQDLMRIEERKIRRKKVDKIKKREIE